MCLKLASMRNKLALLMLKLRSCFQIHVKTSIKAFQLDKTSFSLSFCKTTRTSFLKRNCEL